MSRRLLIIVVALVTAVPMLVLTTANDAQADPEFEGTVDAQQATIEPTFGAAAADGAPELSTDEVAELEQAVLRTHLSGPTPTDRERVRAEGRLAATPAPTGSSAAVNLGVAPSLEEDGVTLDPQGLAPQDFEKFLSRKLTTYLTPGFQSPIDEVSVANGGRYAFATGNWWAARTTDGAAFWIEMNPFAGPWPAHSPFCCDQTTNYDPIRDYFIWQRMGVPGTDTDGDFENVFLLSIGNRAFQTTLCTYVFDPDLIGASDNWFDYPHSQLTEDFYFISWNMFNENDVWQSTVMLRIPLEPMKNCGAVTFDFFTVTNYFTFVPISNARTNQMYWASNWPSAFSNTLLRIYRWDDESNTISWTTVTIPAYSPTFRGDAFCGDGTGNWAGRFDQRVLTGTRFQYQDVAHRGRDVLAWWWNVEAGGSFPQPYIEAAAVYEDTLTLVPGNQGRPLVWNSSTCFSYPSVDTNVFGHHAMTFHYSAGAGNYPYIGAAIADDYVADPPGYSFFEIKPSDANPAGNAWGDYNTLRRYQPHGQFWVGGAHTLQFGKIHPVYFTFGREEMSDLWFRYRKK